MYAGADIFKTAPPVFSPGRRGMLEIILYILAVAVPALILLYIAFIYNRFITLKNAAESLLNQIRVALRKRMDLLAELVEATKSYAKYERETLESVTKLRTAPLRGPAEISRADAEAGRAFANIIATLEAYPNLRASEPVVKTMEAASSVEDEIARLRYTYNSVIQQYNTLLEMFPSNLVASALGFRKMEYLKMPKEVEERPSLAFEA